MDEVGGEGEAGLGRWLQEVERCYAGKPTTPLGQDLAEALFQFPIPRACFEDIVAGCRMDLSTHRYARFTDLRVYCERVASAVGLASIEIFGYTEPATRQYAVELGVALQLTNILRDVASDAARDRIYVPQEDLARFGVSESAWLTAAAEGARPERLSELMAFEVERAREHYALAARLLPAAERRSMLSAEIMAAIYRTILERIARHGYPVAGPRVGLSTGRKAWIVLLTVARTLAA